MTEKEKIKALLEKAKEYNEELYNLVGDLIPGRDAKEIRRQIFINNRLYEQTIALLEQSQEQTEFELEYKKLKAGVQAALDDIRTKTCGCAELLEERIADAKANFLPEEHTYSAETISEYPESMSEYRHELQDEPKSQEPSCQPPEPEQREHGSSITPNLTNNDVMGLFPPPTLNTSEKFWMKWGEDMCQRLKYACDRLKVSSDAGKQLGRMLREAQETIKLLKQQIEKLKEGKTDV